MQRQEAHHRAKQPTVGIHRQVYDVVTRCVPCIADHKRGVHPVTLALDEQGIVLHMSSPCMHLATNADYLAGIEEVSPGAATCAKFMLKLKEILTTKSYAAERAMRSDAIGTLSVHISNIADVAESRRRKRTKEELSVRLPSESISHHEHRLTTFVAQTTGVKLLVRIPEPGVRAILRDTSWILATRAPDGRWKFDDGRILNAARGTYGSTEGRACRLCHQTFATENSLISHMRTGRHADALLTAVRLAMAVLNGKGWVTPAQIGFTPDSPRFPPDKCHCGEQGCPGWTSRHGVKAVIR